MEKKKIKYCLLVDDDVDDQELFISALKQVNASVECVIAKDGTEAIKLLTVPSSRLPEIIFMDLNMPKMSGKECLQVIKSYPTLKDIPVITTSSYPPDREESLAIGAREFITKPSSIHELISLLSYLINY
jgi:CheY-like chemotaxis protein